MTQRIDLAGLAAFLLARQTGDKRLIVALAGPPGSGKSTLAGKLVKKLNQDQSGTAALLPMDGYHFDDKLLHALTRLERKGAPDTFDVGGLLHMLKRLQANQEGDIAVPEFDRAIEIARAGASLIPKAARIIVTEGNYLLLQSPPWNVLAPLFDFSVMLETPQEELHRRLTKRWQNADFPLEAIQNKLDKVDFPNGQKVITGSVEPDFVIEN